jgi:hypothetical protein
VGIALNPYDTFEIHDLGEGRLLWEWLDEEITVEAVKAYLGDRVDWIGPERTADPYYLFQEDFGVWKIFTNQDGSHIRTDLPILVQQADVDCDLRNLPPWDDSSGYTSETWFAEYLNHASARTGARWEVANKYIAMLDKAPDEILDDYTITEHPYYGERYRDDETGVLFSFDPSGSCEVIQIPAGIMFPELLRGNKDGVRFFEEMGVPAILSSGGGGEFGHGFDFNFDDYYLIYIILSAGDMILTKDDRIIIK